MLNINNERGKTSKHNKSCVYIILVAYVLILVQSKKVSVVRYPNTFVEGIVYYLGELVAVSIVPLIITLISKILFRYIFNKKNISFLVVFSWSIFAWVCFIGLILKF